jgi:hypothetical protein
LHYWIGSINNPQIFYRNYYNKFNIISDNFKIIQELKNDIPDKSWMLYLLEIFNSQNIAVELNLISQFDNQNYFEAIFNGYNKYRFTKVVPETGNNYLRLIRFDKLKLTIEYKLKNLNTGIDEIFILNLSSNSSFSYQFSTCFTGIEWWNKIDKRPYPIRFKIEISNLMYGYNDDPDDPNSVIFYPVNCINSNKDGSASSYPVTFNYNGIRNGCFCYNVESGLCLDGLNSKII